ncbi:MAG: PepSY domain-containing protein [Proteobacteria bacterium]|nr:PepSY domain-containing protein [Pseudomonadota bacterium]
MSSIAVEVPHLVRKLHKYISLALLSVWIVQAVTGISSVFHRELDAALLDAGPVPLDEAVLARRIDELRLSRKPARLSSVYASGGDPTQFDVFLHTPDDGLHVLRLDGQGNLLRERPWAIDFVRAGALQSMRLIHESLFLDAGASLFIGLSGLLLATNIVLGMRQAWPGRGQWRRTLTARAPARADMRLLAWHKAVGLWISVPLLIVVSSGVLTAWTGDIESLIGEPAQSVHSSAVGPAYREERQISLQQALAAARDIYPDARLSIVGMPADGQPYFAIRLLQADEMRRVFGKTSVYVDAQGAGILATLDPSSRPAINRFVDAFYAVHTGEAAGLAGRVLGLLCGLGLLVTMLLGLSLWMNRSLRRSVRSKPAG